MAFDPSTAAPFDPTTARPAKAAPVAAPKPPQQEDTWDLIKDTARGIASSVTGAVREMPQRRQEARAEIAQEDKTTPTWKLLPKRVAAAGRGAVDETRKSWDELVKGVRAPLNPNLTPFARVNADAAHNIASAVGLPFAPLAGAIKGFAGPELQATTGLSKDAASNIASGLVPFGAAAKALGGERVASSVREATAPAKAAAHRIFSPATVDDNAQATATIHRMAHGTRRAEAASEAYQLDKHQRVVGNASVEDQRDLARYVDTRTKAAPLRNPKLQPAADAMRDVANRYRTRIENVLADGKGGGPEFVQDYYARLWKQNPKQVEDALNRTSFSGGKQGSGNNLKARRIPTFEDGLRAGLTPVFENPLDATKAYTDNMASFLATHDVQNEMRAQGLAKMVPEGQLPPGWVRLKGVRSTEPAMRVVKDGDLVVARAPRVLAAPENAARVYNNFISKGLDRGDFSGPYQGLRKAANGLTQLKLGLSAYHAATMGQEGIVAEVAKGIGQATRGDVKGGLSTIAKAPMAPVATAMKGGKLRKELLEPGFTSGLDPRIAKAYTEAGGRVNMDRFYSNNSASGDFFQSLKRGTFRRDLEDAAKRIGNEPLKGSLSLAAKAMETTVAPIFKEYIPRLKAGAFASRMDAFLRETPNATQAEIQRFAEKTVDSLDNRFGEMIVDNQFWHKAGFQVAQLLMLSPSWNLGTVREIGGGLRELPASAKSLLKGKGVSDKTAYVLALVGTNALINGAATYLHTGQMPEGMDWLSYRTGAIDQHGAPERALAPGYMKDVIAFANQFPDNVWPEIQNKANPAIDLAASVAENRDWRGDPVYHSGPGATDLERAGQIGKFAVEQSLPISVSTPRAAGSGITLPEKLAGVRQAPSYVENPERAENLSRKYGDMAWRKKQRADARAKAQAASPAPARGAASQGGAPTAGGFDPSSATPFDPTTAQPAPVKPGATNGGDVRPELKPIVDHISTLPELNRITSENDLYHPAGDVHGQGRAVDFTVKGGAKAAEAVVAQLKRDFAAKGIKARIINEYANPSARSTGGHIHVQVTA